MADARYREFEAVASAARTTSDGTATIETSTTLSLEGSELVLYLDVSAASGGSPTLDIDVIGVVGGKDFTLGSFTQKTTTGKERIVVDDCPKDIKINWTIGGATPSFTFDINAHRSF
jgi:hypothetical protein